MRFILIIAILFPSLSAMAQDTDHCAKYANNTRSLKAIAAVAKHVQYKMGEMCYLPTIWDIEAQPSQVITPKGDVIPHTRVQLHREYDSCLYMVRDADLVITSSRCYSGW